MMAVAAAADDQCGRFVPMAGGCATTWPVDGSVVVERWLAGLEIFGRAVTYRIRRGHLDGTPAAWRLGSLASRRFSIDTNHDVEYYITLYMMLPHAQHRLSFEILVSSACHPGVC
jgi:hypothetical protein